MSREHVPLWQEHVAAVQAEGEAQLAEERARVADARAALEARPERIVEKWMNEQEIVAAEHEADRAFRSREIAWQALSAIGVLHAQHDGTRCRCGKQSRLCSEAAVVDRVGGLRAWEAKQAAEHRAGRRHFLPDGHPALLDHRWSGGPAEDWDANSAG